LLEREISRRRQQREVIIRGTSPQGEAGLKNSKRTASGRNEVRERTAARSREKRDQKGFHTATESSRFKTGRFEVKGKERMRAQPNGALNRPTAQSTKSKTEGGFDSEEKGPNDFGKRKENGCI